MPNCSRRARFSRATCSCPPNIKEMVRRTIRIVFNIQAQSVSASLMKINPTRQMDFGEAQVQIGGIARSANGLWMSQIARNLTDAVDGFLAGKRYLIHDPDPLYTREFLMILANRGIQSVKLPPQSPNLNAYAERFVRTIKESCLEQMIFFGEDSLRNAIRHFVAHYHVERNHQGLNNRLIVATETIGTTTGTVRTRRRLGGMLNYYYRQAA